MLVTDMVGRYFRGLPQKNGLVKCCFLWRHPEICGVVVGRLLAWSEVSS